MYNNTVFTGTITLTGTALSTVAISAVEVSVDGGQFNAAQGKSSWSYPLYTLGLSTGGHTVTARVSNGYGMFSETTTVVTYLSNPPVVSILSPSSGTYVKGIVEISGTAWDDIGISSFAVQVASGSYQSVTGMDNWTYSHDTLALADGPHVVTVWVEDSNELLDNKSIVLNVENTSPTISNVSVSTASGVTVSWNTNKPAFSNVECGFALPYTSSSPASTTAGTSFSHQFTSLVEGSTYHYRIAAFDMASNTIVSEDALLRPYQRRKLQYHRPQQRRDNRHRDHQMQQWHSCNHWVVIEIGQRSV